MTWDPALGAVVLFGGDGSAGSLNDAWTFRGGVWTRLVTTGVPPPTQEGGLAFDPSSGDLLLFGGSACSVKCGTWILAAGSWRELNLSTAPPFVYGEGLAEDAVDHGVLLYGGVVANTGTYTDATWFFSNGTWTNIGGTLPPLRVDPTMGWDPTLGAVILFGGTYVTVSNFPGVTYNTTWEYSHGVWSFLALSGSPGARSEAGGAEDPASGGFLITGGCGRAGCPYSDSWTLGPQYSLFFESVGASCTTLSVGRAMGSDGATVLLQDGSYPVSVRGCAGFEVTALSTNGSVSYIANGSKGYNASGMLVVTGDGTLTATFVAVYPVTLTAQGATCASFLLAGAPVPSGSTEQLRSGTYSMEIVGCSGFRLIDVSTSGSVTFVTSSALGTNASGNLTVSGAGGLVTQFTSSSVGPLALLTNPGTLLAIGVLVVAAAVLATFLLRRRRKADPPSPDSPPATNSP